MGWVKIDDHAGDHPKFKAVSDKALRVWFEAICWAARQETDGIIPAYIANEWPKRAVGDLIAVELWVPHPEGYAIKDYLDYNPSKADLEKKREQAKKRMDRSRNVRANTGGTLREVQAPRTRTRTRTPDGTRSISEGSISARSKRDADAPTDDQTYLLGQIAEHYLGKDGQLTLAAVSQLNVKYGRPVVSTAMRRMREEEPEVKRSVYALLERICQEVT